MRQASRRKYHIIYKIVCKVTDKFYYGMHSTDNLDDGYMGSGIKIRRSISKHGLTNHIKEIVEFCIDRKILCEREKEIVNIALLKDPKCMNLIVGGDVGDRGRAHSDENKQTISIRTKACMPSMKGRIHHSAEARKKLSEANKGKKLSEECKQKLRGRPAWNKGLSKTTDERVAKISVNLSIANTGKPMTEAQKQSRRGKPAWNKGLSAKTDERLAAYGRSVSIANAGRKLTAEHIEKVVASKRGKKRSDEARKKISVGRKGIKISPEGRAKLIGKHRGVDSHWFGKKHSDETKQKLKEARRRTVERKRAEKASDSQEGQS